MRSADRRLDVVRFDFEFRAETTRLDSDTADPPGILALAE
jgi:hypothetical protein